MLNPLSAEMIAFLIEEGALRFGEFTLKSGDKSPFFIDIGNICNGRALDFLAQRFAQKITTEFPGTTFLFGPPYKGISLATATSVALWNLSRQNVAVGFQRKEAKKHGEGGSFIGGRPLASDRIVIIDDVLSNGATKEETLATLRQEFGIIEAGVLVVVDRRKQTSDLHFPFYALLTVQEIALFLEQNRHPCAAQVSQFLEKN